MIETFAQLDKKLRNNPPLYIKQSVSIDVFKKTLKTHYFRQCYDLF